MPAEDGRGLGEGNSGRDSALGLHADEGADVRRDEESEAAGTGDRTTWQREDHGLDGDVFRWRFGRRPEVGVGVVDWRTVEARR